ncbi:MAG: hypothetical protein LBC67_00050 [Spirochaetales bacterium]|jgi:hypothetical protein|nr:hypothetical protein [Spirochaetales bacterium]
MGAILALKRVFGFAGKVWRLATEVHRIKATDMLTFEVNEMENLFTILVCGSFMGLPSPPAAIAIELLPYMEHELRLMVARADFSQDALASIMDMLHVD